MRHLIVRVMVSVEDSGKEYASFSDVMEFPEGMDKHIQFGPMVTQAIEKLLQMVYPPKQGRAE
jgi:hypothetical protein